VSVASFIASQRADHAVPQALSCKALGVSESWFYKWHERQRTPRQARRAALDKAVREAFEASGLLSISLMIALRDSPLPFGPERIRP
jgi:hypothetical protein